MKYLIFALLLTTACTQPLEVFKPEPVLIDGSSFEAYNASIAAASAQMDKAERQAFLDSMNSIQGTIMFRKMMGAEAGALKLINQFDGLTPAAAAKVADVEYAAEMERIKKF